MVPLQTRQEALKKYGSEQWIHFVKASYVGYRLFSELTIANRQDVAVGRFK